MGEAQDSKAANKKIRSQHLLRSLTPVPLPIPTDERYRQRQFSPQQPAWWESCVQWFRYYSIQFRWDIERGLARLFHRRWT
ncbi:MAG TPA: hypothetical protein VKV40_18150 [Ktedonobacteraceae bacterium]|nr:hypothetical protein [Ktedonobacteraceae bacterium]